MLAKVSPKRLPASPIRNRHGFQGAGVEHLRVAASALVGIFYSHRRGIPYSASASIYTLAAFGALLFSHAHPGQGRNVTGHRDGLQITNSRSCAVPPLRVRSGWNKCDHSRPGERRFFPTSPAPHRSISWASSASSCFGTRIRTAIACRWYRWYP